LIEKLVCLFPVLCVEKSNADRLEIGCRFHLDSQPRSSSFLVRFEIKQTLSEQPLLFIRRGHANVRSKKTNSFLKVSLSDKGFRRFLVAIVLLLLLNAFPI